MFEGYEVLARLNAEALQRCEEHFLDPDYDKYGRCAEDEEDEEADYD